MNRYLLIDDDYIMLLIHPAIIKRVDRDALIFSSINAMKANELIESWMEGQVEAPIFIFLDINMPEMNGFEFLSNMAPEMKNYLKNSKIIMLSSSIDPRDIEMAKNYSEIYDFAPKPLTMEYVAKLLS